MKVRRVAAGCYVYETPLGEFEMVKVEGTGYGLYEPGRVIEWFITWPGMIRPDAVVSTLREAKMVVERAVTPLIES
jgi:hypothetical protein